MLVVVHDWDVKLFLQSAFDFEAFGGFDVLQVNATESRSDSLDRLNKLFGVFLIHLDVKYVYASENLEQKSLAFHDRLAGERTDVSEAQDCRTIGDNSNQIAFRSIFVGIVRVIFDFQARLGDTGRVS